MNSRFGCLLFTTVLTGTGLVRAQMTAGPSGPPSWWTQLEVNGSISSSWVQNISRTSFASNRANAMSYEVGLNASQHREVAPNWLLKTGLDATYRSVPDYDFTSHFMIGPQFGLRHKFGLGPMAPVMQLTTALTYKAARFAGDRGWSVEGGLRLAKRLNYALQLGISGQWFEHNASNRIFDIRQHTITADLSWDISDRWRLIGSAGRLQGHLVANAGGPIWERALRGDFGPKVSNYYNSVPYGTTELYGPGWVSYTVEARADLWSVSLAHALSSATTVELAASSVFVINHIDVRYPQSTWNISLHHRF